jgi:L-aspartate oxidase
MPSVIVVGSGIAGLVAALRASATHDVTLISKAELAESNTRYAQGGVAVVSAPGDRIEEHVEDTLKAGAGLNVLEAVEVLCTEGPARVQDLIRFGVEFDRENGVLAQGREAAHSRARVLHAGGDATGAVIERALVTSVDRAKRITVLEHSFLADLVVEEGRVVGVDLIDALGATRRITADAVILATGGAGQLYSYTTNPSVTTGDGAAAAWRAGAELADVEFYQFHPTALAAPGNFLISEAVRGDGAVLINSAGERFMTAVHPQAELAPRDVVARGIAVEMARQGNAPIFLDATALGADFLRGRFPTIDAATRAAGFDWTAQPIPVTPAAHYWMGGIATDVWGRTSLPGLFAVGEVACTGAHGANRLASNSLLESVVFADRAARALTQRWPAPYRWSGVTNSEEIANRSHASTHDAFESATLSNSPGTTTTNVGRAPDFPTRQALQEVLWSAAGLHRSGPELVVASERLAGWSAPTATASLTPIAARETANLLELGRVVVDAALAREESRGAHFRSDFPRTTDRAVHSLLVRSAAFRANTLARHTDAEALAC